MSSMLVCCVQKRPDEMHPPRSVTAAVFPLDQTAICDATCNYNFHSSNSERSDPAIGLLFSR
eukprot:995579-Amphidinium_carterae.1